jgi:hypothetical protein
LSALFSSKSCLLEWINVLFINCSLNISYWEFWRKRNYIFILEH